MKELTRRDFIKTGIVATSGLTLGICTHTGAIASVSTSTDISAAGLRANAWLHVGTDNIVTIYIAESEMGQGVMSSLAMLAAEELDAAWQNVRVVRAPLQPQFGRQSTGGSSSVREAWMVMRRAGATARWLFLTAASQRWGVTLDEIVTRDNHVKHPRSKRTLSYGELALYASHIAPPKEVALKSPANFRILGSDLPSLDAHLKMRGAIKFGIDIQLPGRLVAAIVHNPYFGAQAETFDDRAAKKIAGYHSTQVFDSFVAIVARDTWTALSALRVIYFTWPRPNSTPLNSNTVATSLLAALTRPGVVVHKLGADTPPAQTISAQYFIPYQAHATPEPPNATAHFNSNGGDIWAGTQAPSKAYDLVSEKCLSVFGRYSEKIMRKLGDTTPAVRINTTYLGGGFGRRLENDDILQAAEVSKRVDAPVQIIWTREQDLQHDFYRPASAHQLLGAVNESGQITYWRHHIAGPSIDESTAPGATAKTGFDNKSVEGARNLAYNIPNQSISSVTAQIPVRCGLWRSVGHSANAFVVESFIDELAYAARQDPLQFRLAMLREQPRHTRVLLAAAKAAGWGKPIPKGRALGIAVHASFGSVVAQVAEISVSANGLRVHKIYCAIDCGFAVHPDGIRAQMESAIVFGLTAALKGEITFADGRVAQSNFDNYPLLRLSEMPEVETTIIPSMEPPSGAGEPGVPPLAPAVANAIFAATGVRVRKLPILPEQLRTPKGASKPS
ncbi:MAG: molybdopterin cofactor-binding domain-containing protein [Pseudomonadota bacterium]